MNNYQRLLMYLKVLVCNLGLLHRNLINDSAWFSNHEQLSEWENQTKEVCDDLIEAGLALGFKEPTINDSILAFQNKTLSRDQRRLKETYSIVYEDFRELCGLLEIVRQEVPVNIQAKIDEYQYYFNKEANYKLATFFKGNFEEDD